MPNIQETISQVLSPTNATYVNGVSVRRNFSKAVLEAMFQELVEKDGKGVSNKFITEKEANEAGQVFVNRLIPHYDAGREHGSAKNGGAFNNDGYMSHTETVGIEVLQYFDAPIIVPRVSQDRIDIDLVSGEIANYVKSMNLACNGSSWAAKWFATYGADADARNVVKITSSDITNKLVLQRFIEADNKLDEGDLAHDIDAFAMDTRMATFKVAYRPTLIASGVLLIGGANYGYDIAKKGGVDADAQRKLDDGYWGEIDGVEVHGISNLSLRYAAGFCGMPDDEFYKGTLLNGWVSSSYANARGFSTVEQVKIIDARGGQGLEIQPISKLGAVCWYPKGNVAITSDDYSPIDDLKTLFSGVASQLTFKLKSKGSRYYADATLSDIGASTFKLTASAKDDGGTDHLKAGYFKVLDAPVTRVADFLGATATYKGACNINGTATTTGVTVGDGKYVVCLVIADDGTCTLVSKKYEA